MNVCIFGSANDEIDSAYITAGELLGTVLGKRGHNLVFGGGGHGLMGAVARGIKPFGREIIGVAPKFFQAPNVFFESCTNFIYTNTMRERKQIMEDLADSFIVTPGGLGTLEEFFEIYTLISLNKIKKPIAVLNTNKFYDPLRNVISSMSEAKFLNKASYSMILYYENPCELVDYIESKNQPEG